MKFVPTFLTSLCITTLSTLTAFAAPSAKYVPATTDIIITADGLNNTNPEVHKLWNEGLTNLGFDIKDPSKDFKAFREEAPGLAEAIEVLFGLSKDWTTCTTKSITASMEFEKAANETSRPKLELIMMIENPKTDATALEAALNKAIADVKEEEKATLQKHDAWLEIKLPTDEDKDAPDIGFVGISTLADGYLLCATTTLDRAEAIRTQKTAMIAADSPLQKAFTPMPAGMTSNSNVVIKDLAAFAEKAMTLEDLTGAKMQAPFLFKLKTILFNFANDGLKGSISLNASTDTPTTAQELAEMLIGYKALARQMFIPMAFGKSDTKTSDLLGKLTISAEGTLLKCAIASDKDELLGVIGEIKALDEQNRASDEDDDDIEIPIDEDLFKVEAEDEAMTPEEAAKILDALDD